MSINKYNPTTGELELLAGQGKAEYGASTERKGDITIPATTAGNFQTVNVVFAQAMPDNDYAVVIDEGTDTWAHCSVNVTNKTTTGFTLFFVNITAADAPQMTFKYRAFKLYTDTEYNSLLDLPDRVEALETVSEIPVTKVNVASNSGIMAKKSGSVVNVNFSALLTLDQATPGGTILASGFPKPVFNVVRFGLYDAKAIDIATGLVRINSDGNLVADGQGLKQNIVYWGTFTYLTNE